MTRSHKAAVSAHITAPGVASWPGEAACQVLWPVGVGFVERCDLCSGNVGAGSVLGAAEHPLCWGSVPWPPTVWTVSREVTWCPGGQVTETQLWWLAGALISTEWHVAWRIAGGKQS